MKFLLIMILAVLVLADDIRQAEEKLEKLFNEAINPSQTTCQGIDGELEDSCYECYMCGDARLKNYNTLPKQLRFKSDDCHTVTTVCCVPQQILGTRSGSSCGKKSEPLRTVNGKIQERATVRSVLIKEYPWRAWIYRKNNYGPSKVLCAATAVGEGETRVVMTSASCLQGISSDDLAVTFIKGSNDDYFIDVRAVITHPSYTPSKMYQNDIALVVLSSSQAPENWVSSACLPSEPPLPATTCITISDNNSYISTVVPSNKRCESFNIRSEFGQICTVSPLDDYEPEKGAGLLCQDELRQNDESYFVAGVALSASDSVVTYTAVYKYYDWILDTIGKAQTY